jgi:hypothetical protein
VVHAQSFAVAEPGVDLEHPSAARVYDYLLGGSSNWAVDREFGRRVLQYFPEMSGIAQANRLFLSRVVRYLNRLGVQQFLDIGSGVLTKGNTHQIAEQVTSGARVIYAESEPVAFAHGEVLLDEEGDPDRHAIINVDVRRVDELWHEALATGIFDLSKPIAVLILSVLHTLPNQSSGQDIGAQLMDRYREFLPLGSYLGVSQVTDDGIPWEIAGKLVELRHMCHDQLNTKVWCRSRKAIGSLLGDFRLVQPGLVWTPEWHPEEADAVIPFADRPSYAAVWGGVGQRIR